MTPGTFAFATCGVFASALLLGYAVVEFSGRPLHPAAASASTPAHVERVGLGSTRDGVFFVSTSQGGRNVRCAVARFNPIGEGAGGAPDVAISCDWSAP